MYHLKQYLRSSALVALIALSLAHGARATTVYNATGGAENGGDPLNPATGAGPLLADRFVSTLNGSLTSVTLNLSLGASLQAGNGFTVDLFADNGTTGPSVLFQIASVNDSSLTSSFALQTYMASTSYLLTSGQSYYVGVMDNGSNAVLGNTLDPTVLARPDVTAGAGYYNNGGVQANAGGPYEIAVDAAPVPEPPSAALVLSGMSVLGAAYRKFAGRRSR